MTDDQSEIPDEWLTNVAQVLMQFRHKKLDEGDMNYLKACGMDGEAPIVGGGFVPVAFWWNVKSADRMLVTSLDGSEQVWHLRLKPGHITDGGEWEVDRGVE